MHHLILVVGLATLLLLTLLLLAVRSESRPSGLRISDAAAAVVHARVLSLTHRRDRRALLQPLVAAWGLRPRLRTAVVDAVYPADGCRASHVAALEEALRLGEDPICVLEDDAEATQDDFRDTLRLVREVDEEWEGILLARVIHAAKPVVSGLLRVTSARTTAGYLVTAATARRLLRLWKSPVREGAHPRTRHVDIRWLPELREHRWYTPSSPLLVQRAGPSDITGRVEDYSEFGRR